MAAQGSPIRLSADFSAETLQTRREWQGILKVMKGENLSICLPSKDLIQILGEIQSSTDKQKLGEFSTIKPALQQQMLKEIL